MITPVYVETIPNRNSRPAVLLREGWYEGGRVRKRTLANLTDRPAEKIRRLRRVLKERKYETESPVGERHGPGDGGFPSFVRPRRT